MSNILAALDSSSDFAADMLSGLNVRHYNYGDDTYGEGFVDGQDNERRPIRIPFAVMAYDEGVYYDDDGTPHYEDLPTWFITSAHMTRKGAEIEAAYHEDYYKTQAVKIVENQWVEEWELCHHPLRT